MSRNFMLALVVGAMMMVSHGAWAQWNNQPFQFHTPTGGPGLSLAGKQAIINKQLYGQTPDHMIIGPDGSLLNVTRVPGASAVIVSTQGGETIPSYYGRSLNLGGFAPFFSTGSTNNAVYGFVGGMTNYTISGWTVGLIADTGRMMAPASNSTVDVWTAQVSGLSSPM